MKQNVQGRTWRQSSGACAYQHSSYLMNPWKLFSLSVVSLIVVLSLSSFASSSFIRLHLRLPSKIVDLELAL